jgi:hypothetical protein
LKYLLGYPRVRIYAGSWTEWAAEDLPIERGSGPGTIRHFAANESSCAGQCRPIGFCHTTTVTPRDDLKGRTSVTWPVLASVFVCPHSIGQEACGTRALAHSSNHIWADRPR